MAEVTVPSSQDGIDSGDGAFQALTVGPRCAFSDRFTYLEYTLGSWPFLIPLEVVTQELKAAGLGGIDNLGFLRVELQLGLLHPMAD